MKGIFQWSCIDMSHSNKVAIVKMEGLGFEKGRKTRSSIGENEGGIQVDLEPRE
jgi:hypothetical protein